MKKIKINVSILVLGLMVSNLAFSESEKTISVWPAVEIGGRIITSYEVNEYINSVTLSKELKSILFHQVDNNYSEYQNQKDLLTTDLFKTTVQKMALIRLLQEKALQFKDRRYFALTKLQLSKLLESKVELALRPYVKKGNSLEETKNAFVNSLKLNGFPYDLFASDEEIFNIWSKQLRIRLREEYRQNEALRFLCSLYNCSQVAPFKILADHRKLLETNSYLVLRYNGNETLKWNDAFNSLFQSDLLFPKVISDGTRSKIKHFFYLGKIINDRIELQHINDWNLLGTLGDKLGYPKTDDFGRTSGFVFSFSKEGTAGSLTLQIENWLFNEKLPKIGLLDQQNVEEESTMRIVSRHFLDENGDKWVVVGVAATDRIQQSFIGTWIQENFHKLNSHSTPRNTVARDGVENFVQGLFGIGGKYSIIDTPHVDLVISGEGLLLPTVGVFSQNAISVKSSLDLNIYGKNKILPIFQVRLFSEVKLNANSHFENNIGGKIILSRIVNSTKYEAGLFVERFDGELDRRFEGGPSWTTGISLAVSHIAKSNVLEYEFN